MRIAFAALGAMVFSLAGGRFAAGDEVIKHDRRVERAAAQIAAAKIGDLRGGHAHDADPAVLIELFKRAPRLRQAQPQTGNLPPMVMNEAVPQAAMVDPIITGSNRKN